MKHILICSALALLSATAWAKGNNSSNNNGYSPRSYSSSYGPGTGSNPSSNHVGGYTKQDGTYVAPHQRSVSDNSFNNNWGTKGNTNPYTGQYGTKVNPPNPWNND